MTTLQIRQTRITFAATGTNAMQFHSSGSVIIDSVLYRELTKLLPNLYSKATGMLGLELTELG